MTQKQTGALHHLPYHTNIALEASKKNNEKVENDKTQNFVSIDAQFEDNMSTKTRWVA